MLEKTIEDEFIELLEKQHFTYRKDISNEQERQANFREKFNALNKVNLSDNEFSRLLSSIINSDVFETSKVLRNINTFMRDDDTPLNYKLIDKDNWCNNTFEVTRQQRSKTTSSYHVYDVLLLINGLPLVHVELKNLTVSPRQAMQQIIDYKNDDGNGYLNSLLCFVQFFVVSNKTNTFYFANNNNQHFNFNADERFLPLVYFADEENNKITNLQDFTKKFFAKSTLGETICLYMAQVETTKQILMMRPYQVYAVKHILASIEENRGNGYIWHTTGSGKTLTSFKASTLLKDNKKIAKCIFVVDRKDLDRQTCDEYNKFQKDCVKENADTSELVEKLLSTDYSNKVIVTTIQKLAIALKENPKYNKEDSYHKQLQKIKENRIVFIFDECHRSQFGENHKAIKDFFPNSQLFGFTGTPIFEKNASKKVIDRNESTLQTTKDIFKNLLHSYTIPNAIEDNNVLRFKVDYYEIKAEDFVQNSKKYIANSILAEHEKVSFNRKFNAIFATASITDAIEYYTLFKKLQKESDNPLNIACVFSPPAETSPEVKQVQADLEQENEEYTQASKEEKDKKKKALEEIIADYNKQYSTNHSLSDFNAYYEDVQKRIRNQEYPNKDFPQSKKIDITIVVDMLLTGYDSKYLNTLYVDKNLKYHGLVQAFSRTNRVLNDTKPFGNIIDFRMQMDKVDEAIAMFSNGEPERTKRVLIVESYEEALEKYKKLVEDCLSFLKANGLDASPSSVFNLQGDEAKKEFIHLFKEVRRQAIVLDQYTNLTEEEKAQRQEIMSDDEHDAFKGAYIDISRSIINPKPENTPDTPPELIKDVPEDDTLIVPDYELILFASSIIDYDYIMQLIAEFTGKAQEVNIEMTREKILSLIKSDSKFIDDYEYLEVFINTLEIGKAKSLEEIKIEFQNFKRKMVWNNIEVIANKFNLEFDKVQNFVKDTVDRRILDADMLAELFDPLKLGWKEQGKQELLFIIKIKQDLLKLTDNKKISGLEAYE